MGNSAITRLNFETQRDSARNTDLQSDSPSTNTGISTVFTPSTSDNQSIRSEVTNLRQTLDTILARLPPAQNGLSTALGGADTDTFLDDVGAWP